MIMLSNTLFCLPRKRFPRILRNEEQKSRNLTLEGNFSQFNFLERKVKKEEEKKKVFVPFGDLAPEPTEQGVINNFLKDKTRTK